MHFRCAGAVRTTLRRPVACIELYALSGTYARYRIRMHLNVLYCRLPSVKIQNMNVHLSEIWTLDLSMAWIGLGLVKAVIFRRAEFDVIEFKNIGRFIIQTTSI